MNEQPQGEELGLDAEGRKESERAGAGKPARYDTLPKAWNPVRGQCPVCGLALRPRERKLHKGACLLRWRTYHQRERRRRRRP